MTAYAGAQRRHVTAYARAQRRDVAAVAMRPPARNDERADAH
jgi:hypothetical protein